MQSNLIPSNRKPIIGWLWVCLLLVALMVTVGGLTRLTESGLSMVEWKPTTILPPLDQTSWEEEFTKYQQSPQYKKVNHGMKLAEFKEIFWLEYIHRLLGRLVGVVFSLPYLFFLTKKMLPTPLAVRLGGILILGGLQGVIGWYMVKSGLIDQPWVSPVRLAMHLGLAMLIFGLILWHILVIKHGIPVKWRFSNYWGFALILLFGQILLGALVAGMDAGLLYNTFPDMNGEWLPNGIWLLDPWYRNLAENGTTVHFLHRLGALLVTIALITLASRNIKQSWPVLMALAYQITLGAMTVIYGVPIVLASAHQVAALVLFGTVIQQLFLTSRQP